MVMVQLEVVLLVAGFPEESTTLAVKLKEPSDDGVPVMAPVLVFNDNPGGSVPDTIEKL